jgi:hypothetical protein
MLINVARCRQASSCLTVPAHQTPKRRICRKRPLTHMLRVWLVSRLWHSRRQNSRPLPTASPDHNLVKEKCRLNLYNHGHDNPQLCTMLCSNPGDNRQSDACRKHSHAPIYTMPLYEKYVGPSATWILRTFGHNTHRAILSGLRASRAPNLSD